MGIRWSIRSLITYLARVRAVHPTNTAAKMHDDQREQLNRLQSTVDELTRRVNELADRIETQQIRGTNPPPREFEPVQNAESRLNTLRAAREAAKPSENLNEASALPRTTPSTTQNPFPSPQQHPKADPEIIKNRPVFDPSKFEWLLGIRGLMLIGVIIVVVGVGMFLKLARDEGWIAAVSPAMRCFSTAAFGLGLVGLGELLRSKINPLASSGFSAAGIATVYASILASTKMFGLIDPPLAFVLLFIVTAMGIGLGALSNRVMLSLLSLVGAFAVPILLATNEPSRIMLPLYLLSLLTMGLVLSGWRGGHYSYVRQLAWWATGIVGSMWVAEMYIDAPISVLSFVGIAWIMTVAELAVSARFFKTLRDQRPWPESSNAGFIKGANAEISFDPRSLLSPESRWINALFGATVWAVITAGITLRAIDPQYDFIAPLAFASLSILILLAGSLTKLNLFGKLIGDSASPRALFGVSLVINSAMLIVATIAVALGGWLQVIAWIIVGFAAVETGRRIRFRAAGLFGMILLIVAIGRLMSIDLINSMDADPKIKLLGIAMTAWTLQMCFATLASVAAYWRSRYTPESTVWACAAIWIAGASLFHVQTDSNSLGSAWMLLAAFGCWVSVWIRNHPLKISAYLLSGIGMSIVLIAQLTDHSQDRYAFEIHVLSMLITAFAWGAIATVPSSGFIARTISAALAIISVLIALIKIHSSMGTPEMFLFQTLILAFLISLGKRLYAWSLNEIASILLLMLTAGWALYELNKGSSAIQGIPFLRADSLAALSMLITLFWGGRTTTLRELAEDAPPNLAATRRSITIACFAVFWSMLLVASTLEVVRSTRMIFDAGSARGASVSIWWSIFAIVSVGGGFKLHKSLRWAGLSLMGIVAIKVLLIDTMTLAPPARVVAAITVGLIIIATGVLYTRLIAFTESTSEHEPDAT